MSRFERPPDDSSNELTGNRVESNIFWHDEHLPPGAKIHAPGRDYTGVDQAILRTQSPQVGPFSIGDSVTFSVPWPYGGELHASGTIASFLPVKRPDEPVGADLTVAFEAFINLRDPIRCQGEIVSTVQVPVSRLHPEER